MTSTSATTMPAGLRERKKLATRQALAEAALDLALERGWHGFTVADVTETVGVSRRTFSNYFAGKADCVAAASDAWLDDALGTVRDAPPDLPLSEVMQQALLNVSIEAPDRWERFTRVVESASDPELEAMANGLDAVRVTRVAEVIANRLAVTKPHLPALPADDARVELLAVFCVSAGRLCLQRWLAQPSPRNTDALARQLRTAFSLIDLRALTG